MSDATQAEEKREGPTPEQLAQRARFERLSDQVGLFRLDSLSANPANYAAPASTVLGPASSSSPTGTWREVEEGRENEMTGEQCRAARKRLIGCAMKSRGRGTRPFEDGGEGANGPGAYFTMATRARGPAQIAARDISRSDGVCMLSSANR